MEANKLCGLLSLCSICLLRVPGEEKRLKRQMIPDAAAWLNTRQASAELMWPNEECGGEKVGRKTPGEENEMITGEKCL